MAPKIGVKKTDLELSELLRKMCCYLQSNQKKDQKTSDTLLIDAAKLWGLTRCCSGVKFFQTVHMGDTENSGRDEPW